MALVLAAGQRVGRYTVTENLGSGQYAIAYIAHADGKHYLLKQYKSPAVTVAWYDDFKDYQEMIKERITTSDARYVCLEFGEFFEVGEGRRRTYYQTFDFILSGGSLDTLLESSSLSPERRLVFSKVLSSSIHRLHKQRIVHCDLKPENVFMVKETAVETGYQLRLADLDWSILTDRPAPWAGKMPFVGSPFYSSPEHLRGETPKPASDVFTCGIMLWELLGQGHPYKIQLGTSAADTEYASLVLAGRIPKIELRGPASSTTDSNLIEETLRSCLDPDPDKRPTAQEVNQALNGRPKKPAAPAKPAAPRVDVAPHSPPAALTLSGPRGASLSLRITTELGRRGLKQFGEDARFAADRQFRLALRSGKWFLEPITGTPNDTLHNGTPIEGPKGLADGDVIAIGKAGKDIVKLPIRVSLR